MSENDAPLLLDATRLIWRRWEGTRETGIDRICTAWVENYAERSQAVIVRRAGQTILPMSTSQVLFRLLARPQKHSSDVFRFRASLASLALRRGLQLSDRLPGLGRLWLNAGHTGLDIPAIGQWVRRREVRPVYLVHDLIPITHPQFCRGGERERHQHRMRTVLDTATGVVVNSAHTLESLSDFARSQSRAMPPSTIAWPGTPQLPRLEMRKTTEPTFVVLGTIEGRKNHGLLLAVWKALVATLGDAAPRLAIIGRRGWQAQDVFETLDTYDFRGKVVEMGAVTDEDLAAVMAGARALLFPSFAEGFGIPLTEALAMGVPVIASDLPVFEEIGQGIPELVSPHDQMGWVEAILDYTKQDSQRRSAQLARLVQFHKPDWVTHFSTVDQFLESLST